MSAGDILLIAARILERDGWHQGSYYKLPESPSDLPAPQRAPCCVLGAVRRALTGSAAPQGRTDWQPEFRECVRLIGDVIGTSFIGEWNDHPERIKEEVIAVLREAADHELL